jgi:DNA replication protein DnaC
MTKELSDMLKYLRLSNLLAHWDDYLKLAADKNLSHARWLTGLLEEEYQRRRENARQLRLKHARLPEILVLETYPFERQPKLNKKRIMALYDSLSYMLLFLQRICAGKNWLRSGVTNTAHISFDVSGTSVSRWILIYEAQTHLQ